MNPLIDKFPVTVTIDGAEVPINTDFRVSIKFTELVSSGDFSKDDTWLRALQLYYPKFPTNLDQAIERMLWFYQGGKEPPETGKSSDPILDYEQDYDYIYAEFLGTYRIDLNQIEYMHWWGFKAVLNSMKEDAMLEKIMTYRAIDLRDVPEESRAHYRKLKKIYALEKKISEEEREQQDALIDALQNGGDVSAILGGDGQSK